MIKKYSHLILPVSFLFATGAAVASLMLSSVYNLIPCELCWWQRVIMFPLPVILGVAMLRRDRLVHWYVLPFSVVGIVVALYHALLQWGVIGESSLTCGGLVNCADAEVKILGFMTIPLGSLVVFSTITLLMGAQAKYGTAFKNDFKQQLELVLRLIAIVLVSTLVFLAAREMVS